jgi:hypothetical protein
MIKDKFPESEVEGSPIPVFFTDCFDLGKQWDTTRNEIMNLIAVVQNNNHYDTKFMKKCVCPKWREKRLKLITLY